MDFARDQEATPDRRLFNSPWLERLTHTHIAVPITIFMVYATILLSISVANTLLPVSTTVILFFSGWLFFSWVEYIVHRYIFHIPILSKRSEKFQYMVHGVHHHFPRDKDRLAMPPVLSITIATILLVVFKWLINDWVFAFLPGFLVGYALYLLIHFLVHIHKPLKNGLKVLWTNHAIHHYKDQTVCFGVSTPLWDYVYRTLPEKRSEKSR